MGTWAHDINKQQENMEMKPGTIKIVLCYVFIAMAWPQQSMANERWNISLEGFLCFRKIEKEYDPLRRNNPYYLRLDYDGDGVNDLAIMIRHKKTKKEGILVCNIKNNEHYIISAGIKTKIFDSENNSVVDDLRNYVRFYVFDDFSNKSQNPYEKRAKGEIISVGMEETDGLLLFWDGKEFIFYYTDPEG